MIDTIKFLIRIDDLSIIQELEGNLTRFRKDNIKSGKVEFEFFKSDIPLGSHNKTIAVKSSQNPYGFFIEFSVPKYAKGNNVEMIHPEEIPSVIEKLHAELCTYMKYQLPHFSLWPIYRLDICYNWIMNNKDEASYTMDFLRRLDFPRKKKYTYDTSVMYVGSAYTIKFYLKGAEFKANDFKKINTEKAIRLQGWADKIVRFEVGLKNAYLKDFFMKDSVYLKDVVSTQCIEEILNFYLKERVFRYINIESMSNETIKNKLYQNFTKMKATRLYQFYKDFYFDEERKNMFLSGGLNRSTIYRYKKDLKRVGIGVIDDERFEGKNIIEKLVIPSLDSQFNLIDYPNN